MAGAHLEVTRTLCMKVRFRKDVSGIVSEVVPVTLPSGQTILARVQVEGPVDVGAGAVLRRLAIADLRETVEGVTQSVAQALRRVRPDEVSVEFGVELAVKTGKLTSVLAEGSSNTSIKLTLTWNSGDALRTSATAAEDGEDSGGEEPGPSPSSVPSGGQATAEAETASASPVGPPQPSQ